MKSRLAPSRSLNRCGKCGGLGHNRVSCGRQQRSKRKLFPQGSSGFANIDAVFAGAMKAWRPTPGELLSVSRYRRRADGLSFDEIAAQDGVTVAAVTASIAAFAARAGLALPKPRVRTDRLTIAQLAHILGVHDRTIGDWAAKGLIPSQRVGKKRRFSLPDVRAALDAMAWQGGPLFDPKGVRGGLAAVRAHERGTDVRTCCRCRQQLPLSAYPPSSIRKSSWMCRACRRPYTRASDMRRRRKLRESARSEPVRLSLVAQRDGWRCGICAGKVTKATWSLDHIIPISKGGSHTYDNVVLAHRSCNSKRGAGRLPVQAPLFARLLGPGNGG